MFSLNSLVSIIGIIQGIFILSLLISKKEKTLTTKWAIALFIVFIADLLWYLLYLQGYMNKLWFFYGIEYLVLYLYGPTLYLYARSHFEKSGKHFKMPILFFHFLPAILIFILMSALLFREQTINFLNGLNLEEYVLFSKYNTHSIVFNFGLWYVHVITYLIFTVRFLNSSFSKNTHYNSTSREKHIRWIKILFLGYLSFPLVTLVFFLTNSFASNLSINSYNITNALLVFHIFVISYIGYSNQGIIVNPIELLKRKTTNLSKLDTGKIESQLHELIVSNKLYLDETLTLSSMAKHMEVTTHQLSEYINTVKNKSFNEYINAFRVEHSKNLLQNDEGNIYTLEGIASKSGFKSLTTFHRNFKKVTGFTPNQWLKHHR